MNFLPQDVVKPQSINTFKKKIDEFMGLGSTMSLTLAYLDTSPSENP